jgi:membrane protease YdiL (CAAX protease family)
MAPWLDNPKFHRISSRVGMLLLTIGFVFAVRHLKIADRQSLGFGLPAGSFIAEVFKAFLFGALLMMPALITMVLLDMRALVGEPLSVLQWARLILGAFLTGLTVSLIEETFLRGAMQFAITRESGARLAIALTSLVYASTHFIGRYRVAAADVNAGSGVDMLAYALADFAQPLHFIDAFLCLVAIGVFLGMARAYTGNIAACIGLHTGWVTVVYVVKETSKREESSPMAWMLSDVNGFLGWMVFAWTVVIGVALYFWYHRRPQRTIP